MRQSETVTIFTKKMELVPNCESPPFATQNTQPPENLQFTESFTVVEPLRRSVELGAGEANGISEPENDTLAHPEFFGDTGDESEVTTCLNINTRPFSTVLTERFC